MEYEKKVNNTKYTLLDKKNNVIYVTAVIGVNGVTVDFVCTSEEWDNDFEFVQSTLRSIIENSLTAI